MFLIHCWGFGFHYCGSFGECVDPDALAHEFAAMLELCSAIEFAISDLPEAERNTIPSHERKVFAGFDGNEEPDHYSVASFMIRDMGRWSEFSGRSLNSHSPMVEKYGRMLEVFKQYEDRKGVV